MIPCRGQFVPLTNSQPTECKNIAKLLLIPQKKEGTESSFPVKMHLIVHHNAWLSVKSYGFTDEVVKMSLVIRKMAGFYGRL